MPKLEELQSGAIAAPPADPEPQAPNGAAPQVTEADLRYFELTEPIETGGRIKQRIDKLLIDSSEMSGTDYFELLDRYVMEVPKRIRNEYEYEWKDPRFLRLLIVKLNPPMIESDFMQLKPDNLAFLFFQAHGLIFVQRSQKLERKTHTLS